VANYVASYTKKKVRLLRLEQELLRSIRTGAPREAQLRLAEEVRLARIRALRATRAALKPSTGPQANCGVTLEQKIALAEETTSDAILAEVAHDVL
jgi:hypothetical protein